MFFSVLKSPLSLSAGITAFEMEYAHWTEEQNKLICELRKALHVHISDVELRMLVDSVMTHYSELFRLKATAAKADVFYVMSGMWKTSAERFFLWIGGFRPSELLKVLYNSIQFLITLQHSKFIGSLSTCDVCFLVPLSLLFIFLYTSLIFGVPNS